MAATMESLSCGPMLCNKCQRWTSNLSRMASSPSRGGFSVVGDRRRGRRSANLISSQSHRPTILRAQTGSSGSPQSQAPQAPVDGNVERAKQCLTDLAETLVLPPDFLAKLPNDLRLDLNDAAFALSSGPLNQECGERAGELVMGLSRAFEQADTETTAALSREVPSLHDILPSDQFANGALGKRLKSAGRYLSSTGEFGNGELQKLSKAFIAAGEALSVLSPRTEDHTPKRDVPVLKFGSLQVEITAKNAYTGAAIAFVFGLVCWKFTSGLEASEVDSTQYANENATAIATSLRGTLVTGGYACTALSAMATAGLLGLGSNLGPEK